MENSKKNSKKTHGKAKQQTKKSTGAKQFNASENRSWLAFAKKVSGVGKDRFVYPQINGPIQSGSPVLSPQLKLHREIPFNISSFMKGTQYPTLRLYQQRVLINTTAATVVNSVIQATAASFLNFADLANIFDEYRPIRGELYVYNMYHNFQPNAAIGSPAAPAVGVIDYNDTTALASYDAGLSYDTHRIFVVYPTVITSPPKPNRWPLRFEELPDQEWIPTSTDTTAFASLKLYADGTDIFNASRVLMTTGWMDFQFRGQDA